MLEAAIHTLLTLDIAYYKFCQEARERTWNWMYFGLGLVKLIFESLL